MGGVSSWRGGRRTPAPAPGYDPPVSDVDQGGEHRGPPHSWEIHAARLEAERKEELGVLNQIFASVGGLFSALTDPPIDDVLFGGSIQLVGSANAAELDFKQETAFVAVFNYQDAPLWLLEGPAPHAAPGPGSGRYFVQAGEARGVPIRGTTISLWIATPPGSGPLCDLAVYARPRGAFSSAL